MNSLDYINPYSWIIKARDGLYNTGWIEKKIFNSAIISVGNLNVGGSGKTPFIQYLVSEIKKNDAKKQVLIISKSYKAALKKPQQVFIQDIHSPELFGDEPCLLKSIVDADVWSGPVKNETLAAAVHNKNYDFIIIDDGFSHLKIKRDLDIILFDVSRDINHYQMMPFGFMREPWSALGRSDLVILTKTENQDPLKINFYKQKIQKYQKNILTAQFKTELFFGSDNEFRNVSGQTDKNIYFFSGLGHPDSVLKALQSQNYKVIKNDIFPDHFNYTESIQDQILAKYQKQNLKQKLHLVTTEKDFIKLTISELIEKVHKIKLVVSMAMSDQKKLIEIVFSKLKKR